MKINFVGIGAQKCASSWLYQILKEHPQICVSEPKELNFFSSVFDRGYQWYEGQFAVSNGVRAVGEISPSYFIDSDAPARIRHYNPGMLILVNLRNPLIRAYSNHLHELRVGHFQGPDLSFEAGLANNPSYIEQSLYGKHLREWLKFFAREQFLFVLQEDSANDPAAQARRSYKFLGVDANFWPPSLREQVNPGYLTKFHGLERMIRSVGRFGTRLGAASLVETVKRTGLVERIHRINRLDPAEVIPPMRKETRTALEREFDHDLRDLADLLDWPAIPWPPWSNMPPNKINTGSH